MKSAVNDQAINHCAVGLLRWVAVVTGSAGNVLRQTRQEERGDVPGWVMITLMSAVLVAALLAIAGPTLEDLFMQAIGQVSTK